MYGQATNCIILILLIHVKLFFIKGYLTATGWLDEYSDLDLEMRPVFFGTRPDSIKSGMFIMRKGILLLLPFLRESAGNSFNP